MDYGTVEERSDRQSEISDGVAEVEAFHVGPVLFGIGRAGREGGRWSLLIAPPDGIQHHLPCERPRENLAAILLLTGDHGSVGQGNADGGRLRPGARMIDEGGAEVEELWPFARILRRSALAVLAGHEGVGTIAAPSSRCYLGGVQLLSHHRLDGISPQRNHCAKLGLRCHASTSFAFSLLAANAQPHRFPLAVWDAPNGSNAQPRAAREPTAEKPQPPRA